MFHPDFTSALKFHLYLQGAGVRGPKTIIFSAREGSGLEDASPVWQIPTPKLQFSSGNADEHGILMFWRGLRLILAADIWK
jgi:hypothetical protein